MNTFQREPKPSSHGVRNDSRKTRPMTTDLRRNLLPVDRSRTRQLDNTEITSKHLHHEFFPTSPKSERRRSTENLSETRPTTTDLRRNLLPVDRSRTRQLDSTEITSKAPSSRIHSNINPNPSGDVVQNNFRKHDPQRQTFAVTCFPWIVLARGNWITRRSRQSTFIMNSFRTYPKPRPHNTLSIQIIPDVRQCTHNTSRCNSKTARSIGPNLPVSPASTHTELTIDLSQYAQLTSTFKTWIKNNLRSTGLLFWTASKQRTTARTTGQHELPTPAPHPRPPPENRPVLPALVGTSYQRTFCGLDGHLRIDLCSQH
jgi:hypothetical protein